MKRITALCTVFVCAVLGLAGCGGGDDETTAATTDTTAQTPPPKPVDGESDGAKPQNPNQPTASNRRVRPEAFKDPRLSQPTEAEKKAFVAPKGGDDSIQTYGTVAESDESEEVVLAMRSFFAAMANGDNAAICDGLTKTNLEALEKFLEMQKQEGDCPDVLATVINPAIQPEARAAALGVVFEVRVDDDTAFVLFTPKGGNASYFVMKEEDGAWKSTGITIGTEFNPSA